MKGSRLIFLYFCLLGIVGCGTTGKVTPMANIEPVRVSNAATRKSIGQSQEHSKRGQIILKEQGSNLDKASDILKQLLKHE